MQQLVNVSLEPHLFDSLNNVLPILPELIAQSLQIHLREQQSHIPYSILVDISKWSRTDQAHAALAEKNLNPASYSIVALLAGTLTSPERKFGLYVPPKEPDQVAAARARERKAITALANSLLSVVGVGVGAYWASETAGWRNEWVCPLFQILFDLILICYKRTLFALCCAILVAISEAALFLIWQWRRSDQTITKPTTVLDKKLDPPLEKNEAPEDSTNTLRRRRN